MKRTFQIVINAIAASLLSLPVPAQDTPTLTPTPNPKTNRSDYTRDTGPIVRKANRLNDPSKTSEIIGIPVRNYQDEKLGKVEELAVDVESGRIVQVILSIGGLVGIGDTLTAVPPGALHHDVAYKVIHLDADKEKLMRAPKFEMSRWAQCCDSNYLAEVYRYFGQAPAFRFVRKGDAVMNVVRNTDPSANVLTTRKADATWDKDRLASESQSMIPASRLGYVQKASKLKGIQVKTLQEEKLGKVDNLLLDLPLGRIVAVIVSSGGFLELGDELSAIPPAAFRFTSDRRALQLDASKDSLSRAPHFKANQWPDFGQPSYVHGLYRAYRVEPYFSTNVIPEAENTARSIRDR
jgi:sporulation protein YlmC with PRC-barrel domain